MLNIEHYKNFYKTYSVLKLKSIATEDDNEKNANNKIQNDVLIFVMDKSGSMSGLRILNLKNAVIDLTAKVQDNFKHIHYIKFDTSAQEINYDQVQSLNADGGTSFDAANNEMFKCIEKYKNENYNINVIYFTDGEGGVNFSELKSKLAKFDKQDIVFNTIGFSSEANKTLLIELTQSGSSFGTYKLINNSSDIDFSDFEHLFNESKRGYLRIIGLDNEAGDTNETEKQYYFSLDLLDESVIFVNNANNFQIKECVLNKTDCKYTVIMKVFDDIIETDERLKLFESFFNFVLLKLIDCSSVNKDELVKLLKEYKIFIELELFKNVQAKSGQMTTVFELEAINGIFDDLLQTLKTYIDEAEKRNANLIELKSLSYNKISKQKFAKRLDQRTAKNELKFVQNAAKLKELVNSETDKIEKLNIKDFEDNCYLTQLNYIDLIKNYDCLGICFNMTRGGEVVIVEPNFIKINEIGYSSYVSLNSMFMALKYYLDKVGTVDNDEELLNIHGGFMKQLNLKASFLEGTHRAKYNAMLPLYINDLHWKVSRMLLEPLFGYLVTLNISGYASNQYYTLYFLILEKIIYDMLENEKNDAMKRVYEQIKLSCEDILKEFYCLKPKVEEFLIDRTKRTKDEWPNLNSYLLYIYLDKNNELEYVKSNFDNFEYAYFEEQLRRFLNSEFKERYDAKTLNLFDIDVDFIKNCAIKLFDTNIDNLDETNNIVSLSNEELIDYIETKMNVKLFDETKFLKHEASKRLIDFFKRFSNYKFTTLFNYVFDCKTTFFKKYSNITIIAIICQLIIFGYENEKWRFYKNYTSFLNNDEKNAMKFLKIQYIYLIVDAFRSEFNRLTKNSEETRVELLSKKYLTSNDDYKSQQFCTGELMYSKTLKLFQSTTLSALSLANIKPELYILKLFYFMQNSFISKLSNVVDRKSKKNICRLFRVVYEIEKNTNMNTFELNDEFDEKTIEAAFKYINPTSTEKVDKDAMIKLRNEYISKGSYQVNDLNIVLKHPLSWRLLLENNEIWKAKYLYGCYRFLCDKNGKYIDYLNENEINNSTALKNFVEQIHKKNRQSTVAASALTNLVYVYEDDNIQKMNPKSIVDVEKEWINEQFQLKLKNILIDSEQWQTDLTQFKHFAVLDLICDKNDNSTCCAGVMVFELDHTKKVLMLKEAHLLKTKLVEPYISGLLAFREAAAYNYLLKKLIIKPQLLIFDGNGVLHKREFGLASHIGLLQDCVSIGFAKKLHFVNTFPYKNLNEFKAYFQPLLTKANDYCELKTIDNKVLGYAYLSAPNTIDPVFISQGHKISLTTTINIIKLIDSYLLNMNKSHRESIVGYVDKMTRKYLNEPLNQIDGNLNQYF